MRVAVCLRAVVDDQAPVAPRETEMGLRLAGPFLANPVDLEALEMALQLKDRSASAGVTVAALSLAPPAAGNKVLQAALSVGADEAALFWDEHLLEADTLGIARVLASALHPSNFDLILFGDRSADSGTGQVPHQVAEILQLPCLDSALAVMPEEGSVIVEQAAEPGMRRRLRCPLPTVVVVLPAGRVLRYPRTVDRLRAQASAVPTLSLDALGSERRPPWGEPGVRLLRLGLPKPRRRAAMADAMTLPLRERLRYIQEGGLLTKDVRVIPADPAAPAAEAILAFLRSRRLREDQAPQQ